MRPTRSAPPSLAAPVAAVVLALAVSACSGEPSAVESVVSTTTTVEPVFLSLIGIQRLVGRGAAEADLVSNR